MKLHDLYVLLLFLSCIPANAQVPQVWQSFCGGRVQKDAISRYYITPQRIVWISDSSGKRVINPEVLLHTGNGQTCFGISPEKLCFSY
ncbi:MAG: hypothetical protein JW973_17420 [Bacteroidales bacterium]|nr:hypothetical protein [Bacteroidales bacterium]